MGGKISQKQVGKKYVALKQSKSETPHQEMCFIDADMSFTLIDESYRLIDDLDYGPF